MAVIAVCASAGIAFSIVVKQQEHVCRPSVQILFQVKQLQQLQQLRRDGTARRHVPHPK